jgi:hypothetical protein
MEPDLKSAPGLLKAAEAELNAPGALESKPRVMPDEVISQVQAVQRDLAPELDADEARPDGERVHDAAHRAVVRTTLAGLGDDALIYYAATLAWLATLPPPETERAERTKRMRAADDELFAYLWPRYRHHRIYGPMMVRIRSGVGRKDDAEDVLGLIAILRADLKDNPDALAGLPWTEADLTRMEADATRQLETLDEATPAENAARILRHRAWARLELRHEIVRRAGLALTGDTRRYTHLKTT